MPVLPILTIPHPLLKEKARPVHRIAPALSSIITDLVDTLNHFPRCVGIAAPQTGIPMRIIAVDVSRYPKPHPNHGLIVLCDPIITNRDGRLTGREGCLSVPEFTGNVTRAERIRVSGLTPEGKHAVIDAEGFEAVVFQHEIDHLDGMLFLDRVSSLKTDIFRRKHC